jgi:hypothetical protein
MIQRLFVTLLVSILVALSFETAEEAMDRADREPIEEGIRRTEFFQVSDHWTPAQREIYWRYQAEIIGYKQ